MPTRKRTRLEGWSYSSEGIYFLTLCAKDKKPIFSRVVGCGILDAPYAALTEYGVCVQDSLLFLSNSNSGISLEKWVIMPNHVHILLRLNEEPSLAQGASRMPRPTNAAIPKFVSSLKRFTNRKTGVELWQDGYHNHIVRNEPDYLRIWQYIDNNPAVWLEDKYYSE
ncbi:MAG: transposase [Faecousia sp.]